MALPKLDVPIYDTTLPSGKRISFRPFLVKEEKILLMASQAKDEEAILSGIIQILNNCVTDKIKVTDLPVYDVEFLFLQLRAKSVGEIIELRYQCANKLESGEPCRMKSDYTINLMDIKPTVDPNRNNKVQLTDKIGVTLQDPKFGLFNKFKNKTSDNVGEVVNLIMEDCIQSVYDTNNVYYAKDTPKEELKEFVDSLNPNQEKLIQAYFKTMPKIEYPLNFHCPKCQHEEVIMLQGLKDFFS